MGRSGSARDEVSPERSVTSPSSRLLILVAMIAAAAASRLIPHPPNFAPIAAIALFSGASFHATWQAFLIPLAAMVLSDVVIGLHRTLPAVYASFALAVCIGFWLRTRRTTLRVAVATLVSSIAFFVITNFAVWATGSMYPKTFEGLIAAYIAGIPFFRNTVLGDAFYSAVLFGGTAVLERLYSPLREIPYPVGSPR